MKIIFKKRAYLIISKLLKIYLFPLRVLKNVSFSLNDGYISNLVKGALIEPILDISYDLSDDPAFVENKVLDKFREFQLARSLSPSISVFFRCKNASDLLFMSVSSFVPIATEIILIDNNSTDNTKEVFNKLIAAYGHLVKFRVYDYLHNINMPGEGYDERCKSNPTGSLASYTNFANSVATSDYVFRADPHILLLPSAITKILNLLKKDIDVLSIIGICVYGRKLSYEPRIYKNFKYSYLDSAKWEFLDLSTAIKKSFINETAFLHLKYLSYVKYNDKKIGWLERYK